MRRQGFQIGLLGALALLGFGCAQIINADFDKPFQSGGAGGGSTSMPATAGVTSAGGAGGLGTGGLASEMGASTSTGQDPNAKCPLNATGGCDVYVYIKLFMPGSLAHITEDAILTHDPVAPKGFESSPTSSFKLYRSPPVSNGITLYSCLYDEVDFSHFVSTVYCPNGILLGYATDNVSGHPEQYEPLSWFSTNVAQSDIHHNRALIAAKHMDAFCPTTMPYGICAVTDLYTPL